MEKQLWAINFCTPRRSCTWWQLTLQDLWGKEGGRLSEFSLGEKYYSALSGTIILFYNPQQSALFLLLENPDFFLSPGRGCCAKQAVLYLLQGDCAYQTLCTTQSFFAVDVFLSAAQKVEDETGNCIASVSGVILTGGCFTRHLNRSSISFSLSLSLPGYRNVLLALLSLLLNKNASSASFVILNKIAFWSGTCCWWSLHAIWKAENSNFKSGNSFSSM